MLYKAKFAICSEIRTKNSTQGEHHVEFFNISPGGRYVKKPLGFKRLMWVKGGGGGIISLNVTTTWNTNIM
jgi:hypothetical protein